MAQDSERLERAIVGALRSSIHDHGPITAEQVVSAARRIIASVRGDALARAAGGRRLAGATEVRLSAEKKRLAALRRPRAIRSV